MSNLVREMELSWNYLPKYKDFIITYKVLLSHSRYSQNFMGPESSLSCLQETIIGLIPIQVSPVHTLPFYFIKVHLNIIFPSTSKSL
jgi:hypothetical protein